MKSIVIRGIEPVVADRLKQEARGAGKSVNQYLKDLIRLHVDGDGKKKHAARHHDLDHLFGKWDVGEYEKIQGAIDRGRTIDAELWE
jgi:hypothetical protein